MRAIVTGAGGLVGSECVRHFVEAGYDVVGIDNDMRSRFFGDEASTAGLVNDLEERYDAEFTCARTDIRDSDRIDGIFSHVRPDLVVHAAAQPAHDWAAKDPRTDFGVNAVGTSNVLEAARRFCPDAPFIHCSTSKVYGANPNLLPLEELPTRLDVPEDHEYWHGITTTMSIDKTTHSLFGASKAAGDLLVQEYGRYFGIPTVCFRPGCLTGPNHRGAELHGFLSYLVKCTMTGQPYTVFGYGAKQVRCNVHARDLVRAFHEFAKRPSRCGAVYNIGGGRTSNCSMIEAIVCAENVVGRELNWMYDPEARIGDHKWWISDNGPFQRDYPDWAVVEDTQSIIREIYAANAEEWACGS